MMGEEEVRQMSSEQLANYALENEIASYVAETIKTKEIDGEFVYDLDEEIVGEIAGKSLLQKKQLLSAMKRLPRGNNAVGAREGNSAPRATSPGRQEVTDVLHANESKGSMTPMKKDILEQHVGEQCTGEMLFFSPAADLNFASAKSAAVRCGAHCARRSFCSRISRTSGPTSSLASSACAAMGSRAAMRGARTRCCSVSTFATASLRTASSLAPVLVVGFRDGTWATNRGSGYGVWGTTSVSR